MPIDITSPVQILSEDEFHAIAERIIGIAFDVHNEFGRLLDEEIYKQVMLRRAETAGITGRREVELIVRHRDFSKSYFMDLLFANSLMVEAKTVAKLTTTHQAQALHYLLLAEMSHGLLLNFRPSRVEKQFVSTTLNLAERRRYSVDVVDWNPTNEASERLQTVLLGLLDDWGLFLHTSFYREAIIHFFGGEDRALKRVPIYDGLDVVGSHEVCLLCDGTALAMTSLRNGKEAMHEHLNRFLRHARMKCLQWVNLDGHKVEFRTVPA